MGYKIDIINLGCHTYLKKAILFHYVCQHYGRIYTVKRYDCICHVNVSFSYSETVKDNVIYLGEKSNTRETS